MYVSLYVGGLLYNLVTSPFSPILS